ncbi:hypothetical protein CR513_10122, partial [Mucuna pruriens]
MDNIHSKVDRVRRKLPLITFTNQDFIGMDLNQNDPMAIMVEVANFIVNKGARRTSYTLGFSGERVDTRGYVVLPTTFGDDNNMRTIFVQYLVLAAKTLYNIIIGSPTLNTLGAIVSTLHLS